jgi:prepilin-type N-terminal cleavage/methylation domain-containing protein
MRRREDGFTLIELLIVVVIIGIITVPLSNVIIGFLHNTDATNSRLSESHDVQIAAAYFAQDVESIGTRTTLDPLDPQLNKSVEKDVTYSTGSYPCGLSSTPTVPVRFVWDDIAAGTPPTSTLTVISYSLKTVTIAGVTRYELHRQRCLGGASTPTSDVTLAHDLTVAPTVVCDNDGTNPCSGTLTNVPKSVTLALTIQDPKNTASSYPVTLSGQRRQS